MNYKNPDSSRKTFDKIFKTVLEQADVILYVLDARDPTGTRSREVERQIMSTASGSKRLILILNKIDLIPPSVLKAWLVALKTVLSHNSATSVHAGQQCPYIRSQTANT